MMQRCLPCWRPLRLFLRPVRGARRVPSPHSARSATSSSLSTACPSAATSSSSFAPSPCTIR
eukprot:15210225-Alexandrium_andersonii.AAC.1